MKKVLLAGGSGLVGSRLAEMLTGKGYSVAMLTRRPSGKTGFAEYAWDPDKGYIDVAAFEGCKYLVNLAGEGIADKRWTKSRKKALVSSRINSTALLAGCINNMERKPEKFISVSASGYYGDRGEDWLGEEEHPDHSFMSKLCVDWEQAARQAGVPLVITRFGIVLAKEGGFLQQTAGPVKLWAGAVLGNGRQYIPWIHIDDLCRLIIHLAENEPGGTFNACAPWPVSNREMTRLIAKTLGKPLLLPPVPEFMLRIIFGELTDALLMSSRCSCRKVQDTGFRFIYKDVEEALKDLLQ